MQSGDASRWLLLIHQLPPEPSHLRVKIWRRLQRLGAVAVKNSVYVLPASANARESFEWVRQEIVAARGEASICEASFVGGLDDDEIEGLFRKAREADYAEITETARAPSAGSKAIERGPGKGGGDGEAQLMRLEKRLSEVRAIDFFGAAGRKAAESALGDLAARVRPKREVHAAKLSRARFEDYRGRTWVTRQGIFVDRMASAWLIRRFIDPQARFKFVPGKRYSPRKGEVRFDMFEAEFTHAGNRCTFEVLVERFGLRDRALQPIAEIVHDIDLEDARFGREDALGIKSVLAGIATAEKDDAARLARGAAVFEDLHAYFAKRSQ